MSAEMTTDWCILFERFCIFSHNISFVIAFFRCIRKYLRKCIYLHFANLHPNLLLVFFYKSSEPFSKVCHFMKTYSLFSIKISVMEFSTQYRTPNQIRIQIYKKLDVYLKTNTTLFLNHPVSSMW